MVLLGMQNKCLSHDVASGFDITPCNKIDKLLVVYRFSNLHNDVHFNVAKKMTKSLRFQAKRFLCNFNVMINRI